MAPLNTSLAPILVPQMTARTIANQQAAISAAVHDSNNRIMWPLARNQIRGGVRNHAFGAGVRTRDGAPRDHQGWDLSAEVGTACHSVAFGRVEFTHKVSFGDYGRQLCMSFQASIPGYPQTTFYAFYAHLSHVNAALEAGVAVTPNTLIGTTGQTGNAEGVTPHLHFEIRTQPRPGRGMAGRVNPVDLYGFTPLVQPTFRTPEGVRRP